MIGLLDKLKEKFADIRGDYSQSVSVEIKELERRIRESSDMESLANSKAGKKLISLVVDYVEKIDSICMDEQVKSEIKLDLLKQRKAWITVMQTLMGGKSQLEAIQTQIRTHLKIED